MKPTAKHLEIAAAFRRLLSEHDIAPADRVAYSSESVTFLWDEPRVAVVVDFDDGGGSASTQGGAPAAAGHQR